MLSAPQAVSLAKLLSSDVSVATVSLAAAQLVKNGCFPLVLNLLPDRIDWNGNPPSWPRSEQNKNSSFFTARSDSPSFYFQGDKEQFSDVFPKICKINQRQIFFVTFGWWIVNSTTFRLQFLPAELKADKRACALYVDISREHSPDKLKEGKYVHKTKRKGEQRSNSPPPP